MRCSICQCVDHDRILKDYAFSKSLRRIGEKYGVGYRSLHRHVNNCVYRALQEAEQADYENALDAAASLASMIFAKKKRHPNGRRSIIKTPYETPRGRKAWVRNRKRHKNERTIAQAQM